MHRLMIQQLQSYLEVQLTQKEAGAGEDSYEQLARL